MKRWLISLVGVFAATGLALAQTTPAPQPAETPSTKLHYSSILPAGSATTGPAVTTVAADGCKSCAASGGCWGASACGDGDGPRVWFSLEYLQWWIKDGGAPTIAGIVAPAFADMLNDLPADAIQSVFGGAVGGLDYHNQSGIRLSAGAMLNDTCGLDVSYFALEKQGTGLSLSTNGPFFFGPTFFDVSQARPIIILFTDPERGSVGDFSASANNLLWGFETNAVMRTCAIFSDRAWLLLGFRYLEFKENLDILSGTTFEEEGGTLAIDVLDSFHARNQFYGIQLGFKTESRWGNFSVNSVAKVAVGEMRQVLNIAGGNVISGDAALPEDLPGTVQPGGILAQPTNIGRHSRDRVTAIPELTVNVGYHVTDNVRAFIGYNFLYINNVARPGDQIDVVDSRQIRFLERFDPTVQAIRPVVGQVRSNDFWAHGFNFGIEISF